MFKLISGPTSLTDVYNYVIKVALGYDDIIIKHIPHRSTLYLIAPKEIYDMIDKSRLNSLEYDKSDYIKTLVGMCGTISFNGDDAKYDVCCIARYDGHTIQDVINCNMYGIVYDAYDNLSGNVDLLTTDFPIAGDSDEERYEFDTIKISHYTYHYIMSGDTIYLAGKGGLNIMLSKFANGKKIMYL